VSLSVSQIHTPFQSRVPFCLSNPYTFPVSCPFLSVKSIHLSSLVSLFVSQIHTPFQSRVPFCLSNPYTFPVSCPFLSVKSIHLSQSPLLPSVLHMFHIHTHNYCANPTSVKKKVKQSRYRPGVAQRVPESYGKAVPLQAWSGPECSRKLRLSALRTGRLHSRKYT
jgi:hypothetical protein